MTGDVTRILLDVTAGKRDRLDELLSLLYRDLHAVATSALRGEWAQHSLRPSDLLHEVYLKLINQTQVDWKNRSHFLAFASTLMRRILVDHARKQLATKRGGGEPLLSLAVDPAMMAQRSTLDLIALDQALTELAALNPRHARVIELRFFGGLSIEETALVLETSDWTVKNDWRMARSWLLTQLEGRDSV